MLKTPRMKTLQNKLLIPVLLALAGLATATGCKSGSFDERTENLNKGTLTIWADTGYAVLVEELIQSYENVYPESDIRAVYASDAEVMAAMMADKTRMAITGHGLTKAQEQELTRLQEVTPEQFRIGREAIAVIAGYDFADSVFDFDAFLQGNSPDAGISYVFNKENSSIITELLGTAGARNNMFSLASADTVIGYVSRKPDAIGFIAFALISDFDDPAVQEILKKVKVLQVAKADSTGKKIVTPLSQSTIASNDYPFQRYVTVIKGNTPELLGTGFVNFLYRSKSSRIMLKAGLVPEKMPERQVKIVE